MTLRDSMQQTIHYSAILLLIGMVFVLEGQPVASADTSLVETDCPRLVLDPTVTINLLAENTLTNQNHVPLFRAMSQLWLGRNVSEANATLIQAFKDLVGDTQTLTPEIADDQFKWQMRLWLRIYGMFNSYNGWFPGRLEPDTEAVFHELFWNYALAKSTVERADPRFIWFIQGSENHDLMDLSNAFLSLEFLQHVPQYANRPLRDGRNIGEHVNAWSFSALRWHRQRSRPC